MGKSFLAAWRTGNKFSLHQVMGKCCDCDGEVVFGNDPGIWRVESSWRVTSHPSTLFLRDFESRGSGRAQFMTHTHHQPSLND